jgi:HSP20 family molecular chaperone IbpA
MPLTIPIHPLTKEIAEQLREQFRRMLLQIEDIRSQSAPPGSQTSADWWVPAVDVAELEETILVRVELPGVTSDHVQLTLTDQTLRVEGRKERPAPPSTSEGPIRFLCLERGFGAFSLRVPLRWQIDVGGIAARLGNGILEVRLPKASHSGREIHIPILSETPSGA